MKIVLEVVYQISSHTTIDLPEGKTWDDVAEWDTSWGILRLKFKDGTEREFESDDVSSDSIDWKCPDTVKIFKADEDGDYDYLLPPLAEHRE